MHQGAGTHQTKFVRLGLAAVAVVLLGLAVFVLWPGSAEDQWVSTIQGEQTYLAAQRFPEDQVLLRGQIWCRVKDKGEYTTADTLQVLAPEVTGRVDQPVTPEMIEALDQLCALKS